MRLFLCHAWKDCHYLCTVGWPLKSSTGFFCLLCAAAPGLFFSIDLYIFFLHSPGKATRWHQSTIDDYSFRDKLHTIVTVFSIVLLHWYCMWSRGIFRRHHTHRLIIPRYDTGMSSKSATREQLLCNNSEWICFCLTLSFNQKQKLMHLRLKKSPSISSSSLKNGKKFSRSKHIFLNDDLFTEFQMENDTQCNVFPAK